MGVPFIYLVSEYGKHKDGGIRRTSIWPAFLALKLSSQYKTPSLSVLYSDHDHPEDYNYGTGVQQTFDISNVYIDEWLGKDVKSRKIKTLYDIFLSMGHFILEQYADISPHLPGRELLTHNDFINFLIFRVSM